MNTKIFALATLVAALAACSSIPERNVALDEARGRVGAAQRDSQVGTLAPDELKRASDSLMVAEQAWNDRRPRATVDHLSYMTAQRVVIAQETAESRAAQAITARAASERDQLRLALRTSEADRAQAQLAVAQQENARKAAELAQAEAEARRNQTRVAIREAQVSDLEAQLRELNAKKTDRGMVVTLGDILFDSGQARLLSEGSANMVKLADFFKKNPTRRASIEGYTDSVGSASANLDLSERRANAVRSALVSLGVPPDQITTRGYGMDNPTATNSTAAGRQMNRRVEIVFTPMTAEVIAK